MPSRRTLIGAGLAATTALAVRASDTTNTTGAGEAPPFATAGRRDPQVLTAAADDFGHLVRRRPQAVFTADKAADIADVLRSAAARRLSVAARGQGHSTYGRAMADIVVDMKAMRAIHEVLPDRVTVDAGATWRDVLTATLAHGLTPPVLTNYLDLSVGGTLAIGGIGGTSWRRGLQTDNVVALTVVTGDGRELLGSADADPDLFDAVRAGLGQCGIITRATLRLERAPQRVRRYHLIYPDLRSMSADQRLALGERRFDHLQGAVLPDPAGGWKYQIEGVVFHGEAAPDDEAVLSGLSDHRAAAAISDLTYLDDVSAFARLETILRANGQWFHPHPWLLTFLRGSDAEDVAGEILSGLTADDIGPFGRITCYPIPTEQLRTPLVRMPPERVAFVFNLVRMPASDDAAAAGRMVAHNRAIYERIRRAGGVLYPVSACPMSGRDWMDHFGTTWRHLADARRRYDPDGTLTPGYEVFGSA